MEIIVLTLLIGYALGYYVRGRKVEQVLRTAKAQLTQQYEAAQRQVRVLSETLMEQKRKTERGRQYAHENNLSNTDNQLRFVAQCDLRSVKPVNNEAARILYTLDKWVEKCQPEWRVAFEVSMGSFIETAYHSSEACRKKAFSSYSGKRVDFLLINRFGKPVLAVEYHGSGHYISDNAEGRMEVKRLALQKAGIPLLEIPKHMKNADIFRAVSASV